VQRYFSAGVLGVSPNSFLSPPLLQGEGLRDAIAGNEAPFNLAIVLHAVMPKKRKQ